jgi:hypothetical protein
MSSVPPCFVVAYSRISVATPASRGGPHVTRAAYSCERVAYVLQSTKLAEELPRIPIPRTPVNKGKKSGSELLIQAGV